MSLPCAYLLLEEDSELDKAMYYLEQAAIKEESHLIVHTLARLKRETGYYREAIKFYEMALKDVTEPFPIFRSIADCYYFLEDYRGCVRTVSKSILLGSDERDLWMNSGFALQRVGLERVQISNFFIFLTRNLHEENEVSDTDIEKELDKLLSSKVKD